MDGVTIYLLGSEAFPSREEWHSLCLTPHWFAFDNWYVVFKRFCFARAWMGCSWEISDAFWPVSLWATSLRSPCWLSSCFPMIRFEMIAVWSLRRVWWVPRAGCVPSAEAVESTVSFSLRWMTNGGDFAQQRYYGGCLYDYSSWLLEHILELQYGLGLHSGFLKFLCCWKLYICVFVF